MLRREHWPSPSRRFNVSCIGYCRRFFFCPLPLAIAVKECSATGTATEGGRADAVQTNRINLNMSYSILSFRHSLVPVFIYLALTLVSHDTVGRRANARTNKSPT